MLTTSPIGEEQDSPKSHAEGCTCNCSDVDEPSLIRILDLPPCEVESPQTTSSSHYSTSLSSSPTTSSRFSLDSNSNCRVTPHWPKYRRVLESRGFELDTSHSVSLIYRAQTSGEDEHQWRDGPENKERPSGYHRGRDDDSLCHDPGLPDNLFRGTRLSDGIPVVVKAVHRFSRELALVRFFGSPPMREEKTNHCIPILDIIDLDSELVGGEHKDAEPLGLIVMEEWSSQLMAGTPRTLGLFLDCLRQCIEHIAFMHRHHVAHLDISLHNFLTDYKGQYACIDYELSDRFEPECPRARRSENIDDNNLDLARCGACATGNGACQGTPATIQGIRGTEVPSELEREVPSDPFKVDIWALGILILRCCKMTGYDVPELKPLVEAMVAELPEMRPSAEDALRAFQRMTEKILVERLEVGPIH